MFDNWTYAFVILAAFGDIASFSLCMKLAQFKLKKTSSPSIKVSHIWSQVARICLVILIFLHIAMFFAFYHIRNDFSYIANELLSKSPMGNLLAGSALSFIEWFINILQIWPFNKKTSKLLLSKRQAFFVGLLMTIFLLLPFFILTYGGVKMYKEGNWENPSEAIERLENEAIQCWESITGELSAENIEDAAKRSSERLENAESIAEEYLNDAERAAKLQEINDTRIKTYRYEDGAWIMWIQFSDLKRESSEIKTVLTRNDFLMQKLRESCKSEYELWVIQLAEADFRKLVAMADIAENLPAAQSVNVLSSYRKIERQASDKEIRKEAAINCASFSFYIYEKGVAYDGRLLVSDAQELLDEMENSEKMLPELSEDASWVNLITHLHSLAEND